MSKEITAKEHFRKELINAHAKRDQDGFYLFVHQIPFEEMRIFISHFLETSDYVDAMHSDNRMRVYIDECREQIQEFIDAEMENKNRIYMDEHGLIWLRTSNGDLTCVRR